MHSLESIGQGEPDRKGLCLYILNKTKSYLLLLKYIFFNKKRFFGAILRLESSSMVETVYQPENWWMSVQLLTQKNLLPPTIFPLSHYQPTERQVKVLKKEEGPAKPQLALSSDWMVETPDSRVSESFVEQVKRGWQSLPELIRQSLIRAGWKIKVGKFLTELASKLKGVTPRGGDPGTTADNRGGVCIAPEILLAEYQWLVPYNPASKNAKSKSFPRAERVSPPVKSPFGVLARSCAADRTVRHEIGHALDHFLNRPSTSRDFSLAYEKDFQAMDEERKAELNYYIQSDAEGRPSLGGMSEAFAEAFATLYGGGCSQTDHFQENFPHIVAFVQAESEALVSRKGKPPSAWSKGPPAALGIKT
jgi:hypothetical protein